MESCTALVEDDHGDFRILDWHGDASSNNVLSLTTDVEPEPLRLRA